MVSRNSYRLKKLKHFGRPKKQSARRSDGNGRRCGNGHEKYNNQLAKVAMDGATAMDGDGRRNRAATMAAMEDGH